jgi:hypothetical protein
MKAKLKYNWPAKVCSFRVKEGEPVYIFVSRMKTNTNVYPSYEMACGPLEEMARG